MPQPHTTHLRAFAGRQAARQHTRLCWAIRPETPSPRAQFGHGGGPPLRKNQLPRVCTSMRAFKGAIG
eukprot:9580870-Alexandrium_andersonii.AAC.1